MKKLFLTGIAVLLLTTGTAHAYNDPDLINTPWDYCSANFPGTIFLAELGFFEIVIGVIILILWLCVRKRGYS